MLKTVFFILFVWIFPQTHEYPSDNNNKNDLEFLILHNNDMHSRFEQIGKDINKCLLSESNSGNCYGGFGRVAYLVRKFRKEENKGGLPVLYLNAGDTYQGSPWFSIFKDEIVIDFMNKLMPNATSLGNHEFDENVEGLTNFLNNVMFPVLACNVNFTNYPKLMAAKHFAKSTVLEVAGSKIGIIGYVTPDTKFLAAPNNVEFLPEIESINLEAAKLTSNGVNIIIALGHSGYKKDQEIAAKCPDVDLVIGGHTNTFLYNGKQPDSEPIIGPYPTVIQQSNGKKVPVVQAYAYTKYLGKLHVKFDEKGNLIEFFGNPILLNESIGIENDVVDLLEQYRPGLNDLEKSIVGYTKVYLEGSSKICRTQECNLGNLVADSMIFAGISENKENKFWTDASIAFIMGGGIRTSIQKRLDGSITEADIISVLPFQNDLFMISTKGKIILNALEHSASFYQSDSNGGFLQMAGAQVVYDYNKPKGKRVISVDIRCAKCNIPKFEPLKVDQIYNVIIPDFLLGGGDGHKFEKYETKKLKYNDKEALQLFLKHSQYIYPELESRIVINERSNNGSFRKSLQYYELLLNLCLVSMFFKLHDYVQF